MTAILPEPTFQDAYRTYIVVFADDRWVRVRSRSPLRALARAGALYRVAAAVAVLVMTAHGAEELRGVL